MNLRGGTWTILFTDVVGSTEERSRLGDDPADEMRKEHDATVNRAERLVERAVAIADRYGAPGIAAYARRAVTR